MIAIVNPDPDNPPVLPSNFPRFQRELNPITYFGRVHLWRLIAAEYNALDRVVIVPTWHPRETMKLEQNFFPPQNLRVWFVPYEAEEELLKIQDFERLGEHVSIIRGEPPEFLAASSTEIRAKLVTHENWQSLVPKAIIRDAKKLLASERLPGRWRVIPVVGDYLDEYTLRALAHAELSNLVFCLCVEISADEEWWRNESPKTTRVLTFYERYEFLLELAGRLKIGPPLVVPLFVRNGEPILINAFLPALNAREWYMDTTDDQLAATISALVQKGERFSSPRYPKLSARDLLEINGMQTKDMKLRHYEARRMAMIGDKRDVGKINFFGPTSVHGNVTNVEGNQIVINASNLSQSVEKLIEMATIGSASDVEKQISQLAPYKKLPKKQQQAAVKIGVKRALKEKKLKPSGIKRVLRKMSNSMAGAAGKVAGSELGHMVIDAISNFHAGSSPT